MKNRTQKRPLLLVLLGLLLVCSSVQNTRAQSKKKATVRLKLQYFKVMNEKSYFEISARARVDRKNIDVAGIKIGLYNEINDERILLGELETNHKGIVKYVVNNNNQIQADSTGVYSIIAMFKGNDDFKKSSKSLSLKDAEIQAKLVTIDSVHYISASFIDSKSELPIENEALGVQIDRLFMPYQIEEFSITDENGTILVPIEKGIPGIDGKLNIEVILNAHDDYGTIKSIVKAPIGTPIVDESDFDERTMWSPRNKTPLFLLIFPNLLIFGMWGLIFYLTANLYRISKSK